MQQDNNTKKESIIAGVLKYSISSLANLLIGFLSVLITTRILLPEVYGQIILFMSTATVALYLITCGLDVAYIRFFNDPPSNDSKRQLLYKNLVVSSCVCLLSGVFIYFVFGANFTKFIWKSDNKTLIIYLFLYVYCHIILRYFNITFRMGFKAKEYNIQNIMLNCLSKILIICGALYKNDFLFIISIITVGYLLVISIYSFIQKDYYIPVNKNNLKDFSLSFNGYLDYLKFALFSAPTYIIFYANTMFSQQIISYALNSKALGIYSSSGVFASILRAVSGGFANYWSAYVYKNYNDEVESIKKMHDLICLFAIFASSFLVICRDIIYMVIGSNYHDSKYFFSILLIFPILHFITETTDKGIYLSKNNHIVLINNIISVILNLGLSYCFVRKFGLIGAASANAISGAFLYISNSYFGQKYYKSIKSISKSCFGFISLIAVLSIPAIRFNIVEIIIYILLIDLVVVIGYWKELRSIFKLIKSKWYSLSKEKKISKEVVIIRSII